MHAPDQTTTSQVDEHLRLLSIFHYVNAAIRGGLWHWESPPRLFAIRSAAQGSQPT